jgi:hypothetical protein
MMCEIELRVTLNSQDARPPSTMNVCRQPTVAKKVKDV